MSGNILDILSPGTSDQLDQAQTALKIWAVGTLIGVWLIAIMIFVWHRR